MTAKVSTAIGYVVEEVKVTVDGDNKILTYTVHWNESYDNGGHQRQSEDLWPLASANQKNQAQGIQNLIKTHLDNVVLGT